MRILHIVSNISIRSGVMTVLINYYKNIDRNNVQFDFLYFDDKEITYKKQIEELGGKIYKIDYSNNPINLFKKVNYFVKNNIKKYKVIHLHEPYLIGALIGIKNKNNSVKIISHSHVTKFSEKRLKAVRNRIMSLPNVIVADYLLACSKAAGKAIFGKKFEKQGKVLYNAIDISKFYPDENSRKEIREQYNITDKYVIGHVGNFNPQKNHFFLVECFYELQKQKDNAVLVLIGDGQRRKQVLDKCKQLGILDKVIYLGVRNDVNKVMNAFDCFVLPSIYEGLGIVLIEAQATGLPCVFSDVVPKEADVFTESNIALSLAASPKTWAEAILNCERLRTKETFRGISEAGYDIKTEAKKLEHYYKGVIK